MSFVRRRRARSALLEPPRQALVLSRPWVRPAVSREPVSRQVERPLAAELWRGAPESLATEQAQEPSSGPVERPAVELALRAWSCRAWRRRSAAARVGHVEPSARVRSRVAARAASALVRPERARRSPRLAARPLQQPRESRSSPAWDGQDRIHWLGSPVSGSFPKGNRPVDRPECSCQPACRPGVDRSVRRAAPRSPGTRAGRMASREVQRGSGSPALEERPGWPRRPWALTMCRRPPDRPHCALRRRAGSADRHCDRCLASPWSSAHDPRSSLSLSPGWSELPLSRRPNRVKSRDRRVPGRFSGQMFDSGELFRAASYSGAISLPCRVVSVGIGRHHREPNQPDELT